LQGALDVKKTTSIASLGLALASKARRELITADERLANAVAAYLPVKWLGSL
jgi:predicted nucleic acid-binding protein